MANRRVDTLDLMVESILKSKRRIDSANVEVETGQYPIRHVDIISVMVEYEPTYLISMEGTAVGTSTVTGQLVTPIFISGRSSGLSAVNGQLSGGINIIRILAGALTINGVLHGMATVKPIDSIHAEVKGMFYGNLLISGIINDNLLVFSYLWNLTQNNIFAVGVADVSDELKSYITIDGISYSDVDGYGTVLGFGHLMGINDARVVANSKFYGTVLISGIDQLVSGLNNVYIRFVDNDVNLFVDNGLEV